MELYKIFGKIEFSLMVAATIIAFLRWPRLRRSFWASIPFYFLFQVLSELLLDYLDNTKSLEKYNPIWFYYFASPMQFLFLYWFLYQNIKQYATKTFWWAISCAFAYLTCLFVDIKLAPNVEFWNSTFSFSIGILVLLILILRFFYLFINSNDIINFKSNISFWFMLGLLVFHLFALPFWGLRNTLYKNASLFTVCWYINIGLSCLMNVFFIIGLLWTKPK